MRVADEPMVFSNAWLMHLLAAVSVLVGMLTVALFVVGVLVLTAPPAHAHAPGVAITPAGFMVLLLGWSFALLICLVGYLMLAEVARRAWRTTTNQVNGGQ